MLIAVRTPYGHGWHAWDTEKRDGFFFDGDVLCGQRSRFPHEKKITEVIREAWCPTCLSRMTHRLARAIKMSNKWKCVCGGTLTERRYFSYDSTVPLDEDSGQPVHPLPESVSLAAMRPSEIVSIVCDTCHMSARRDQLERALAGKRNVGYGARKIAAVKVAP